MTFKYNHIRNINIFQLNYLLIFHKGKKRGSSQDERMDGIYDANAVSINRLF